MTFENTNVQHSGIMLAYFANWGTELHMADTFNRWVSLGLCIYVGLTNLFYRLFLLRFTSCLPESHSYSHSSC
jgi:hypothetical protein